MKLLVLLAVIGVALSYPQAGLVGPSGVIGPSGAVGPAGPVQFHQPAFAFFGHNAHAHAAAIHRARSPAFAIPQVQPAPRSITFGLDAAGCLVGPSGKVCPTGNIQFS